MTLLWIEMMNCFKFPPPPPVSGFVQLFSIRFPHYLGAWNRLIRNGELF